MRVGNTPSGGMDFHLHGLAVALAAFRKPCRERLRQALRLDAKAGLKLALSGRKRVVELSRTREIAHGEAVEPFERAGPAFATNDDFDREFAGIHCGPKYSTGRVVSRETRDVVLPAQVSVRTTCVRRTRALNFLDCHFPCCLTRCVGNLIR